MTAPPTAIQHPGEALVGPGHRRSRDDEFSATTHLLARAANTGDPLEAKRLRDEAVSLNLGLARAIASRYRNRGIAYEDLVQVGCVGVVKAVHGFDPTLEHDFLAYATPTVVGEIKRHFRDHGWAIRPPRSLQQIRGDISLASTELTNSSGARRRPPRWRASCRSTRSG